MSEFNYRFSIIPGWIVTHPKLKGRDLQVLCLLGRHTSEKTSWWRRSQVKMAAELDISRSTVQASINRLVELGAVARRVIESPDGRDSAHMYRVIYDRDEESIAEPAWQAEDADQLHQENDPISDGNSDTPPAGISAGGAGPESAPPASSGSAPIKDSELRAHSNQTEREPAARENETEENPKALERRFRKWWSTWPSFATDTESTTRRAWDALTVEQRTACEDRTADYLRHVKASGRQFSKAAATYLSERAWERLDDKLAKQAAKPNRDEGYTAYSRAGTALRLSILLRSPIPLRLNPIEEKVIENSPEKADMMWRDKREKHGWPEALKIHEHATAMRKFSVPDYVVASSSAFEGVELGSAIWDAWKRLFHDRCWPWLSPLHGGKFLQFPIVDDGIDDPDEAVAVALQTFQCKLLEGMGNDNAA